MRVLIAALIAVLPAAATADAAPPPPVGVYECFGQMGPLYGAIFGILDARTYATMNKQTGHYAYDPSSGVLTMVDGPLAHVRYLRKVIAGSDKPVFRMLDDSGRITQYMCPRNNVKDPHRYPW